MPALPATDAPGVLVPVPSMPDDAGVDEGCALPEPASVETLPFRDAGRGAARLIVVVVGGDVAKSPALLVLPPAFGGACVAVVMTREACGLEGAPDLPWSATELEGVGSAGVRAESPLGLAPPAREDDMRRGGPMSSLAGGRVASAMSDVMLT